MVTYMLLVIAFTFGIATWLPSDAFSQAVDRTDPVEMEDLEIVERPNYEGSRWLFLSDKYAEGADMPVGYATWDPINRRYRLFNMKSEYKGFYQGTIGQRRPIEYQPYYDTPPDTGEEGYHHWEQYLAFDKNDRYKGVIILSLGGRPITAANPYGELGGRFLIYHKGNIPVSYPSLRPQIGPYEYLEDLIGMPLPRPRSTR